MLRAFKNDDDLRFDHILHFLVALAITIFQSIIALHENNDASGHLAALLSTAGASAAGIQAAYHLLSFLSGKDNEEGEISKIIRNFLTTLALVSVTASYAYEVVQLKL